MKTIFEKSQNEQKAYSIPKSNPTFDIYLPNPDLQTNQTAPLPEISELDLMRHFSELAKRNIGIDTTFYPLGSCTMKLNPRVNELIASMPEFNSIHPLASDDSVQGNLEITYKFIQFLCSLCGMDAGTLVPNAGAQGELTGIKMIAAYHAKNNESNRNEMLIPDNAHGTNPATAALTGYRTITLKTNNEGEIDLQQLRTLVSKNTAGLMLTNPNTLGLFSRNILEVTEIVHEIGGLLYYDGANLNAIMNIARPGDMGFDVMHLNLHKTFSTPHGGGGPGSGPVLCKTKLTPFLPIPKIIFENNLYKTIWDHEDSIGCVSTFRGNFLIYLRAYLYSILHGHYGLRKVSEIAVLNANYLKKLLSQYFKIPFPQPCMHEFVVQADNYPNIKAYDIAKRLLDYGFHAPTVYFPLIIPEGMLFEPTETESLMTLNLFFNAIVNIITEIKENPEIVKTAPHHQSVKRLDEVLAVKNPILKHQSNM